MIQKTFVVFSLKSIFTKRNNLFLLLALIFVLNVLGLHHKRLTYDEGAHYQYGMNILNLNSDRFDDSKMPFSSLNAIPKKIWDAIEPWGWTYFLSFLRKVRTGRFVTIFFSILVGYFVFRWTKELYQEQAAFLALLFYAFSPNILAHSRLITTDLYAAGMITIALYYFWKLIQEEGWKNALLSSSTLGLSQLSKYTCVYLVPIFLLIVLFVSAPQLVKLLWRRQFGILVRILATFSQYALLFALVVLFIINAGFLFNKSFRPLKSYSFQSEFFQNLQSRFSAFQKFPVPLPSAYLEGLDLVKYYDQPGKSNLRSYLFGQLKKADGFKGYFFYAFLFKEPIAIQLCFGLALLFYWFRRNQYHFLRNEIFLLVPILFFTIYFNFFFRVQLGIRFFIVVLPLLYIFCGSLFKTWNTFKPVAKVGSFLLSAYLILSTLSYTPHYLSYFNELVWDRKQAYKILADSNIDWGENTWHLEKYMQRHPDTVVSPEFPRAGKIAVGVNELTGVNVDPAKYKWLRDHFEPVEHIAYSYLVYQIEPRQLETLDLTT